LRNDDDRHAIRRNASQDCGYGDGMGENNGKRRTETIVLWHGQYSNDGLERLEAAERYCGMFNYFDVKMEGQNGDWRITAKAYVARDRPMGSWPRPVTAS
jgi:hypothetical protein